MKEKNPGSMVALNELRSCQLTETKIEGKFGGHNPIQPYPHYPHNPPTSPASGYRNSWEFSHDK